MGIGGATVTRVRLSPWAHHRGAEALTDLLDQAAKIAALAAHPTAVFWPAMRLL